MGSKFSVTFFMRPDQFFETRGVRLPDQVRLQNRARAEDDEGHRAKNINS